jgi:hypothetical protein
MTTPTAATESEERNAQLVQFARDRAIAIAISNFFLVVLIGYCVQYWPKVDEFKKVFVAEVIVIAVCALVYWQPIPGLSRSLPGAFGRRYRPVSPRITVVRHRNWLFDSIGAHLGTILFVALIPMIVLNFVAMRWLVNMTGGYTVSPFAQLPLAMILMGQLMADKRVTQIIILLGGGGFLAWLIWHSYPDSADGVKALKLQFGLTTALSLGVGSIVNFLARPGEQMLEVLSAEYGNGEVREDVTEIVLNQVEDGRLDLVVANDLFGDPAPGVAKQLDLQFKVGRRRFSATVDEGIRIQLP